MWKCKHCNQEFSFTRTTDKANHGKHCSKNPKRAEAYEKLKESSKKRFDAELGEIKQFDVVCSCCGFDFTVDEREKQFPSKQNYFCSRSCSNSIGGKAKSLKYHYDEVANYVTVAWRYHERKCLVCGEENVVAVHHLNEIHADNRPENLVPLCPTHHQYMHSRHKTLIEQKVNEYVKSKWG
jgi:hypothetical protein